MAPATSSSVTNPVKSKDIDLAWLNQALGRGLGKPVVAFDVEIIGEGVGVLGELARTRLTFKDGTTASVVCKFSAVLDETREFARDMGFYESELNFYEHMADDTPVSTPHIYYQHFDKESYQFVIVMEDVDGTVGDQVEGCSADQAHLIVSELAALHAAWNDPARLDNHSWLRRHNNPDFLANLREQIATNLPLYKERFPELVPSWLAEFEPRLGDLISALGDRFDASPHTLVHGDYRLDNFVFRPNGSDGTEGNGAAGNGKRPAVTILDWQIVFRSMATFDLGYFMFQSLDADVRRENEKDLIATYVAGRHAAGDTGVTARRVRAELPYVCFFCIVYPIIAGGLIDLTKPRSYPLIKAISERAFASIEDYDSLAHVRALM